MPISERRKEIKRRRHRRKKINQFARKLPKATVSERALIRVRPLRSGSFAQCGISPQRSLTNSRADPSPSMGRSEDSPWGRAVERTAATAWVGAMLKRGSNSGTVSSSNRAAHSAAGVVSVNRPHMVRMFVYPNASRRKDATDGADTQDIPHSGVQDSRGLVTWRSPPVDEPGGHSLNRVWITKRGPPDVLRIREEPDPGPARGEIRVRVSHAGVNFADVMARLGLYPEAPPLPFVPGYEISGTVDAVGEGTDESWLGRRVTAVTRFGGYADLVCLPPALAVPTPDSVPDDAAASLPVNYLTAHQMLHRVCAVREGETVLVHGAAGGVGTAAVQLCGIVGARVIGTASTGKHDLLRESGVEPVDSRSKD